MPDECHVASHPVQNVQRIRALARIVLRVQPEIEQREFELPQHRERRTEMSTGFEPLEQLPGKRLTGAPVAGSAFQHLERPRVVFHELARQLDGIPRYAVDAGEARIVHPREQMMQHVAEFMKQRDDVSVRQQGNAAIVRR
jgi:hypothetical protein